MYFIKLFTDVLDDTDMGKLPDNVWRRLVMIFLLAADLDQDGVLLPVEDLAWRLRIPAEYLELELETLIDTDFIYINDEGIPAIDKDIYDRLTGPVSDKERRRQSYHRKKAKDNKNVDTRNVQKMSRKVTKRRTELDIDLDIEDDKEERAREKKVSEISNLYQNNIGIVSPITAQEMTSPEYLNVPLHWWEEAVKIAADNNIRKWRYIRGVLDRSIEAGVSPVALGPPGQQKGHSNGQRQQRQNRRANQTGPAGVDLDELPSVNIYTGETVPPVGSG